jgi:hypothetical protein
MIVSTFRNERDKCFRRKQYYLPALDIISRTNQLISTIHSSHQIIAC